MSVQNLPKIANFLPTFVQLRAVAQQQIPSGDPAMRPNKNLKAPLSSARRTSWMQRASSPLTPSPHTRALFPCGIRVQESKTSEGFSRTTSSVGLLDANPCGDHDAAELPSSWYSPPVKKKKKRQHSGKATTTPSGGESGAPCMEVLLGQCRHIAAREPVLSPELRTMGSGLLAGCRQTGKKKNARPWLFPEKATRNVVDPRLVLPIFLQRKLYFRYTVCNTAETSSHTARPRRESASSAS